MLPKNYIFQNCLLKISFSKKTHFENCYLKKYIYKIALSKNINLIATIYSLSESSEKYQSHQFLAVSKLTAAKQVWLEFMKIFNFITIRFHFSFQKKFIIERLAMKLLFLSSLTYRHMDRYLKNVVSNSIVHVIKNVNFQVYRVHPDGFIEKTWKLMTNL